MSLTVVSTGIYLLFVQPVIKQGFQMKKFCFYFCNNYKKDYFYCKIYFTMKQIFTYLLFCTLVTSAMADTYNVTFKVNMNEVAAAYTTPEVNGTFNGWCGGCNPFD